MTEDSRSFYPADPRKIWHYTSFPALLSIFQKKQLWFTPLAELEDPWEGRSVRWYKRRSDKEHEDLARKGSVHCWHTGNEDSDLMWKVYAPAFGVAIESIVSALQASFCGAEKSKVRCEPVRYVESSLQPDPFVKRKHFKEECEFRAHLPYENTRPPRPAETNHRRTPGR